MSPLIKILVLLVVICTSLVRESQGAICSGKSGKPCALPFQYKGTWYNNGCVAGSSYWWCATSTDGEQRYHGGSNWDYCDRSKCVIDPGSETKKP